MLKSQGVSSDISFISSLISLMSILLCVVFWLTLSSIWFLWGEWFPCLLWFVPALLSPPGVWTILCGVLLLFFSASSVIFMLSIPSSLVDPFTGVSTLAFSLSILLNTTLSSFTFVLVFIIGLFVLFRLFVGLLDLLFVLFGLFVCFV